jgi:hypothetical protein
MQIASEAISQTIRVPEEIKFPSPIDESTTPTAKLSVNQAARAAIISQ